MKALKIIMWIVIALVLVIAILGIIAPKEMSVERQTHIEAPVDIIINQVKHFERFEKWSPWSEIDPDMETRIEGTDGEPGTIYYWEGNEKAGKGKQTLVTVSNERIDIHLQFEEPFKSEANTYFEFVPDEQGTIVSWGFNSRSNFPWNIFGLFMDMESMIGKDYEKGLAALKILSENIAAEYTESFNINKSTFPLSRYLIHRETVAITELSDFFGNNYPLLYQMASASGYEVKGAPTALYYDWNEESGLTDVAAAIPISLEEEVSGIDIVEISGEVLLLEYSGHYDDLPLAYSALMEYINSNGYEIEEWLFIEEYLTDPQTEPDPSKWRTNIYVMLEHN